MTRDTDLLRAYTLQSSQVLQGSERIVCGRRHVSSPHWLLAYQYMRTIYRKVTGRPMRGYPMWAWQVSGTRLTQREKYETICRLEDPRLGDSKVILHLTIPRAVALLTSYNLWGTLLEYCLLYERTPRDIRDWLPMCTTKVQRWDKVQVVLPYIERDWIRRVEKPDPELVRRFL
jgi:hypothetical protein